MQSFVCGTRLCFGADAPAALAGLHAERVLLVTDPYFAENGTAARYAAAFPGAQVEQFSDVAPDPPLSLVARGVARLQALRPDQSIIPGLYVTGDNASNWMGEEYGPMFSSFCWAMNSGYLAGEEAAAYVSQV